MSVPSTSRGLPPAVLQIFLSRFDHFDYCTLSLPGDVYVTRHSNLSEVHVIFHLVTDPLLSVSDIPARNPVMVGLRNCLHAASHHDIHTITIPLLMVHDMSPVSQIVTCVLISIVMPRYEKF